MNATVDDPSTGSDAAVPAQPDTGTGLPPFTFPTFPRRDAGTQQPVRDAGTTPPAPVTQRVGPAGGLLVGDGIALDVPEGAVTREIQVTFAELPTPPAGFVGKAWLVSPPTTRFAKPVKVAIQLSAELLAQAPGSEWVVSTLANGAWVPLSNVGNDANDVLSFGFTDVLGPFALTRRVPGDAGVVDAALPEDASIDAGADAGADAAVDAEVDAGAPVPVCTAGACANGICIQGATNYACMCNAGFAAAADQHSCVAVDPCAAITCTGGKTCSAGACACPAGTAEDATGVCAAPPVDPCAAVMCLPGNVCTAGVCACTAGLVPAADGSCTAPPTCASTCAAPNTCVGEVCTPPSCASTCAAPNTCVAEVCTPPSCASTCAAPNTCVAEVCTPPSCASTCAAPNTCVAEVCTPPAPVLYCPAGACANGTCVEGAGDYSCSCGAGFMAAADLHSCVPKLYCPAGACANGTCVEGAADYSCTCGTGYVAAADLHSCVDANECAAVPAVCPLDKTCVNDIGTFHCACDAPNVLDPTTGICGPAAPPAM